VGPRKVGGGWLHWSFVVVVIEKVMGEWATKSKERVNTEWEPSHVLVKKGLDLLG
jgi:hypothetical protein